MRLLQYAVGAAWLLTASLAAAQPTVELAGTGAVERLAVPVDADDDDEDGTVDARQSADVPADDLLEVRVLGRGSVTVRVEGGLRLVRDGRVLGDETRLRPGPAGATIALQGTTATTRSASTLTVENAAGARSIPVTVVGIAVLGGDNAPLDATRDAARISHRITNDASLPRRAGWDAPSPDPDNVRIEIWDPSATGDQVTAALERVDATHHGARGHRVLTLTRPRADAPFRSEWVRLVGDQMDQEAPGVGDRVLRVALRDEVRVRYQTGTGQLTQSVRVGRPGDEDGPAAARRGRLRIRILRVDGVPAVGGDDATALRIGRDQVRIANEIWLQCLFGFGPPEQADVAVVDPPIPSMVAVGDLDGLPAVGGGEVRLRAGGQVIGPIATRPGAPATTTALDLADALRAAGLHPTVTVNAPTEIGAGRSADVVVRDADGELVRVEPDGARPLTTDPRQTVQIGVVNLSDGLLEFDNMTAAAGTLEERALVKTLGDDDPTTVDILVVNRFSSGTRQGEAFIEADGGAMVNTLILDRNGMRQEREAWTQSHELGHILLDHPFHPDNIGPDRPWLLMDSDSSLGLVTGPKRLTTEECARARHRSGANATPALLSRHEARETTPPPSPPFDRGYPR